MHHWRQIVNRLCQSHVPGLEALEQVIGRKLLLQCALQIVFGFLLRSILVDALDWNGVVLEVPYLVMSVLVVE